MTEEDQMLVAKAALAGVRFYRTNTGYWKSSLHDSSDSAGGKYTIGRAAAYALLRLGMMTEREHENYSNRTCHHGGPVDVDISALQSEEQA